VDESFLVEKEIGPWIELPLWVPKGSGSDGLFEVNVDKAVSAGMTFRPLQTLVEDTLEWDRTRRDKPLRGPLTPEKESAVLNAWREKKG
ncbi:MAG TPA: hypothetical protein VNB24_02370, partial [Acidimicrobiales bacterium]|nr:hypothetical protein [Acidimicrobiales bacterium]